MASCGIEADLPGGPRLSPAETTYRWLSDPFSLLEECAAELGDRFVLEFTRFGRHVVVSHPEDVRAVFAGDPRVLRAGRGNALLEPILGRHSLLLADGERHAEQRARLVPAFRPERIAGYARLVVEATRRRTAAWDDGATVSLQRAALAISREVILRAALGLGDEAIDETSALVERLMAVVGTNAPFDEEPREGTMSARLAAARGALAGALRAVLERRRASDAGADDVLSLLVRARDASGAALGDAEVVDQLLTMVLAGHETTASSITWAVVALLDNPEALERLRAELDGCDRGRPDEGLGAAPLLQATCLEVLRLFPVVPVVSRELGEPFRLRDTVLPAGVFVTPCAYLAHRRADSFPDPRAFRPERFLGRRPAAHVYFPFGGGARRCLGMGFALLEMQIVLGMLLRGFCLAPLDARRPRPVRRAVTIVPSGGTRMRVERRRAA